MKYLDKMTQLTKKKELIEWLMALENDVILDKISELKKKETYDFENKYKKGLKLEEFRSEIKKRIKDYFSDKSASFKTMSFKNLMI